jgi:ParB family chromosome partitioning protein
MVKPTDKASSIDLSDIAEPKPRSVGVNIGAMFGRDLSKPKAAVTMQHEMANSDEAKESRRLKAQVDELTAGAHDLRLKADSALEQKVVAEAERAKAEAVAAEFEGALAVRALDTSIIRRSIWANRSLDEFESTDFAELRTEIRSAGGNTQPIKVRKIKPVVDGQPEVFEIVYGHRRYQACKEEGVKVSAVIVEEMTDRELFEAMERENRGRKNLSAWEQGMMYQDALSKGLYPSARKLEEALNVNHSDCSRALQLAKLPLAVINAFKTPLDLQVRWSKLLTDAMERNPDALLAQAKEITLERENGRELPAADVFSRLVGLEVAKTVSKVIKVGGKSFTVSEKGGQISYLFDKLEKSKRDQIEKFIKGVLAD